MILAQATQSSILIAPLSEVGLIGIIGAIFGGIVMVIRELKRTPGDASPPPPADNSDVLGKIIDATNKATAADTKADAAIATGARTVDRVVALAKAMPSQPIQSIPAGAVK